MQTLGLPRGHARKINDNHPINSFRHKVKNRLTNRALVQHTSGLIQEAETSDNTAMKAANWSIAKRIAMLCPLGIAPLLVEEDKHFFLPLIVLTHFFGITEKISLLKTPGK